MLELIWTDQVADLPPQYWHLVVKNDNFTFLLLELILADEVADFPFLLSELVLADLLADLPPIDHISLEHHYTKYISHTEECTYTHGRCTPNPHQPQAYRALLH